MIRIPLSRGQTGFFYLFSLLLLLTLGIASPRLSFARNLTGRLGAGFANDWANSTSSQPVPVLSGKYHLSRELAVSGNVGASIGDGSDQFTLGGKFYRNVIMEPLLNFYLGGGAGWLKDGTDSGVEFKGFFGSEFFFQGLESLGFSFEAGIRGTTLGDSFNLSFTGELFNAGVHFYF